MDLVEIWRQAGAGVPPARVEKQHGQTAPNADTGRSPIKGDRLQALAGQDWPALLANPELMAAFASAVEADDMRVRGEAPPEYTTPAVCRHCGPVWLWPGAPAEVLGCPWCVHVAKGRKIPRPGR